MTRTACITTTTTAVGAEPRQFGRAHGGVPEKETERLPYLVRVVLVQGRRGLVRLAHEGSEQLPQSPLLIAVRHPEARKIAC